MFLSTFAAQAAASAAAPVQHEGGNIHVNWAFPDRPPGEYLWAVDQIIWIEQKAATTFWALVTPMTGGNPGDLAYMGLQTDSDLGGGDAAFFSVWNADQARDADGTCQEFTERGIDGATRGKSCRVSFNINTGVQYRYRIVREEPDETGQWWGAWILDTSTGVDVHLGDLHVASTSLANPNDFSEYFGKPVACDQVPVSIVDWTRPAGNTDSNGPQYAGTWTHTSIGSCIRGSSSQQDWGWTTGFSVVHGGADFGGPQLELQHYFEVGLGRPLDPIGWTYWLGVTGDPCTVSGLSSAAYSMLASPEFVANLHVDVSEIDGGGLWKPRAIQRIYLAMLGRAPSQSDIDYWSSVMSDSRPEDTATVVYGVVASPEYVNRIRAAGCV